MGIDQEKITVFLTLFWLVTGGFLGGLFDFFNRFEVDLMKEKICFQGRILGCWQVLSLSFMNAALGVGGALAIQFAMISIGKFQEYKTVETQVLLLTISVVAGFGGRRFLSLISSKLEDQIGEANRKSQEAINEVEETMIMAEAMTMLESASIMSERKMAIKKLEEALINKPKDRKFTILTGRLYRRNKDYKSAINTLSKFLETKATAGEYDHDYADVLYNRACYNILHALEGGGDEQDMNSGLEDLRESVKISPENAEDAKEDPDFSSVRERDEFKKIVA